MRGQMAATNNNDKPNVLSVEKSVFSSTGYTNPPEAYKDFINATDLEPLFGGHKMSERELYNYLRRNYPDVDLPPFTDEFTIDEMFDAIRESDPGNVLWDNTYNWSWWGPVIHFGVLGDATQEPYAEGVVIARPHLGGDVRGNYGWAQAFKLENYAEETPWYDAMLNIDIVTDKGKISLNAEDMEAYYFYVGEDETETFEEGDNIKYDDLSRELIWEDVYDLWA